MLQQGFHAGGDINPARFVILSTTIDNTVTQAASATAAPLFGVSQNWTGDPPIPSASTLAADAASGLKNQLAVYTGDEDVFDLELGGSVARGDNLTSDGSGKGVTAASTNYVGAVALQNGSSGQIIRAQGKFGRNVLA